MIVVSNTSPLHYLVLIHAEHILPKLFGEVFVPPLVLDELTHTHTPDSVCAWASHPPVWLKIQSPTFIDSSLTVDAGEIAAISLAMELRADALLIDDRKGRLAAKARHVPIAGTIAVLEAAASKNLIDLQQAFDELRRTPFRATEHMLQQALKKTADRRTT